MIPLKNLRSRPLNSTRSISKGTTGKLHALNAAHYVLEHYGAYVGLGGTASLNVVLPSLDLLVYPTRFRCTLVQRTVYAYSLKQYFGGYWGGSPIHVTRSIGVTFNCLVHAPPIHMKISSTPPPRFHERQNSCNSVFVVIRKREAPVLNEANIGQNTNLSSLVPSFPSRMSPSSFE